MSGSNYDAIVVGGGHNGMTAALTLAQKGKKVAIVEKTQVGGLCRGMDFGGVKTLGTLSDTSLLRRSPVRNLGLEKYGLQLENKIDSVFVPQRKGEGEGLHLHHDANEAAAEIAKHSKKDAEAYKNYRSFINRIKPIAESVFDHPVPNINSIGVGDVWDVFKKAVSLRLLGKKDMMEVLRIGPMCVADFLREYFETELINACLAGPAVYGTWMGPWSPSSNANLLIYESLQKPGIKGGAPALVAALQNACSSKKVELKENSPVAKILVNDNVVSGVRLENGEELRAKVVLSSLDPKTSMLDLIDCNELDSRFETRLKQYRMRGTTAVMHLELDQPLSFDCRPDLKPTHVRISENVDELERAFDAVKYRQFSVKPALDIRIPSHGDEGQKQNGKHVAHIGVHFAPYELEGGWSVEKRDELGQTVLARLGEYCSNINTSVSSTLVQTPQDISDTFSLHGGHLHHGEHAPDQLLVRPTLESNKYQTPISGLYLCGGGSHPGGGITCAPGYLGAQTSQN